MSFSSFCVIISYGRIISPSRFCSTKRTIRKNIPYVFEAYDKKQRSYKGFEVLLTNDVKSISEWIQFHVFSVLNQRKHENDSDSLSHYDVLSNIDYSPLPLGFDIEWRAHFEKGIPQNKTSIVQLSTSSSSLIIQLTHMINRHREISLVSMLPQEFIDLMKSKSIIKVGVGIANDLEKLKTDYNIEYDTFLDLGSVTKSKLNLSRCGLESLSHYYFGVDNCAMLKKTKSTQISNWEMYNLTDKQLSYAAYDALAAVEIYNKMKNEFGLIDFKNFLNNNEWLYSSCIPEIYKHHPNNRTKSITSFNRQIIVVDVDDPRLSVSSDATTSATPSNVLFLSILDCVPLSRKKIQKLLNEHAKESTYKLDMFYRNLFDLDREWYAGVADNKNVTIKHKSFWRYALGCYMSRFSFLKINAYSLPQMKYLIAHPSESYLVSSSYDIDGEDQDVKDTIINNTQKSSPSSFSSAWTGGRVVTQAAGRPPLFTKEDYDVNRLVMRKYIDLIETQTKPTFISLLKQKSAPAVIALDDVCGSVPSGSISDLQHVFVTIENLTISVGCGISTNKAHASEEQCKQLLSYFINEFQHTIPPREYLESVITGDKQVIIDCLRNLNKSIML